MKALFCGQPNRDNGILEPKPAGLYLMVGTILTGTVARDEIPSRYTYFDRGLKGVHESVGDGPFPENDVRPPRVRLPTVILLQYNALKKT
jgi:hypothetical protein